LTQRRGGKRREEAGGGGRRRGNDPEYRIKNKNLSQNCGKLFNSFDSNIKIIFHFLF